MRLIRLTTLVVSGIALAFLFFSSAALSAGFANPELLVETDQLA